MASNTLGSILNNMGVDILRQLFRFPIYVVYQQVHGGTIWQYQKKAFLGKIFWRPSTQTRRSRQVLLKALIDENGHHQKESLFCGDYQRPFWQVLVFARHFECSLYLGETGRWRINVITSVDIDTSEKMRGGELRVIRMSEHLDRLKSAFPGQYESL